MPVSNLKLVACQEPNLARPRQNSALKRLPDRAPLSVAMIAKRALSLTSDAIVLTLAAPFLAVWWIVRTSRRLLGKI
jgi:hypothetical protein